MTGGALVSKTAPTATVTRRVRPSGPVDPLRHPETFANPGGRGTDLSRFFQPPTEVSLWGRGSRLKKADKAALGWR